MMINLTRPYYLAPVHGEPRHQHLYREMALQMGYPDHRIFTMVDGRPLEIGETNAELGDPVPCGRVLVDNAGNAGVTDEVLRDRSSLANDGIVIVTVALDVDNGEVIGSVGVDAKGYSGNDAALRQCAEWVWDALRNLKKSELQDVDFVRHTVADTARRCMIKKAQLRPLVVPAVLEV